MSVREGPNVRLSFDAVRAGLDLGSTTVEAFVGRRPRDARGVFDDDWASGRTIYGVYTSTDLPVGQASGFDAYWVGYEADRRRYEQGLIDEVRHTLGTRWFGRVGGFDANVEGFLQVGDAGAGDILAWSVGSEWGYTFVPPQKGARSGPLRAFLRANFISGDDDPNDPDLNTFQPMFPRGSYFGEIGILGPANLMNLQPGVTVPIGDEVKFGADVGFFARASRADGLYNNDGQLFRRDGGSNARFIGVQPTVELMWMPSPELRFRAMWSWLDDGAFVRDSGQSEDAHFFFLEFRVVF